MSNCDKQPTEFGADYRPHRPRFSSRRVISIGLALVGSQILLLVLGGLVHSPTANEPGHLVAGISTWMFGRFDIYKVNPPLVRTVAAAPVVLAGVKTDWSDFDDRPGARPEFELGDDFIAANHKRSFWLFAIARWACIPFAIVGAGICFRWTQELYGEEAPLLSLGLWCFCPNILGHSQLITPDVPAAALGLASCYMFWRWLKQPSWSRAAASGLALGIAELAKFTLIIFVPLWIFMWLIYRLTDRSRITWRLFSRELRMLAVQLALALYVINFGYGFEGTLTRLGDYRFVSSALGVEKGEGESLPIGGNRFAGSWLASLPVPLPRNYVLGIDLQKCDFERYYEPSYLNGTFCEHGWWYYYIYAAALKVPLGTWTLFGLALTLTFWACRGERHFCRTSMLRLEGTSHGDHLLAIASPTATWRDEFVLLCPAVAILVLVSSQTGFTQHMRYLLPAFGFVFVWIGRIVPHLGRRHWIVTTSAAAALVWSTLSSLYVYPHSLSYFNEIAGGPIGGPEYLIHSNVDWGQDLLFLKQWLDNHPEARPLKLAYFGFFDPKYLEVEYVAPEDIPSAADIESDVRKIPPGWYAISVNFVRGLPGFACKGDGTKIAIDQFALAGFQKLKPIAIAGYSIYIYHVPGEAAQ
jgi:4-amino-4-deoxy-L-arabinose transferase-like glycosyltransferase